MKVLQSIPLMMPVAVALHYVIQESVLIAIAAVLIFGGFEEQDLLYLGRPICGLLLICTIFKLTMQKPRWASCILLLLRRYHVHVSACCCVVVVLLCPRQHGLNKCCCSLRSLPAPAPALLDCAMHHSRLPLSTIPCPCTALRLSGFTSSLNMG